MRRCIRASLLAIEGGGSKAEGGREDNGLEIHREKTDEYSKVLNETRKILLPFGQDR